MSVDVSNLKTILVTGATGKQGRAFISSILLPTSSSGSLGQRFRILALTRDPSSPAAKSLASQIPGSESDIELVKGDLNDQESLRTVFQNYNDGIWGVIAIIAFPGLGKSSEGEERQGRNIADLSLEFGVSYFVYSSALLRVDEGVSEDGPKGHQKGKATLERHVKELGNRGLKWTILKPGFFMENFDGTIGKITVAVLRTGLQPQTKVHLIAVDDIGHVAAAVFRDPDRYTYKSIPVVGDALTAKEQDEAYRKAMERPLPSIPTLLAKTIISLNSHTRDLIKTIDKWYQDASAMDGGFEQPLQDAKEVYPAMMTFGEWAKKRDIKTSRAEGWNNVSLLALLTGRQ